MRKKNKLTREPSQEPSLRFFVSQLCLRVLHSRILTCSRGGVDVSDDELY